MSKALNLIDKVRSWQPVAYLVARGGIYTTTLILGGVAAWYGSDPQPDWLPRALAVAAFLSGSLALVNLSRPTEVDQ